MRKVIDLLDEVVEMGFMREEALGAIDASLDDEYGVENRGDLTTEEIPEELYDGILFGFECVVETRGDW